MLQNALEKRIAERLEQHIDKAMKENREKLMERLDAFENKAKELIRQEVKEQIEILNKKNDDRQT